MLKRTHIAAGFAAMNIVIPEVAKLWGASQFDEAIPCLVAVTIGSLLPDIDNTDSTLGKFNPFAKMLTHRGFFHSLVFVFIAGAIYSKFYTNFGLKEQAFIIGMLSHIFIDMFNIQGVQILWPYKRFIRFPLIRIPVGGLLEKVICVALFFIVLRQATPF